MDTTLSTRFAPLTPILLCLLVCLHVVVGCDAPAPPSQVVARVGTRVALRAAPQEPVAASVYEALMVSDAGERLTGLATLLDGLGPEQLPAVRQGFEAVFVDLGDPELVLLAGWWARFDPEGAWAFTEEDWRARSTEVMRAVVGTWALADLATARAAILSRPAGPVVRASNIGALVLAWDRTGEPGLFEFLANAPKAVDVDGLLGSLIRRRSHDEGAAGAVAWAAAVPESAPGLLPLKTKLFEQLVEEIAAADPVAAAGFATEHGEAAYCGECYRAAAFAWGRADGPAAMEWISSLPPGEPRDLAVQAVFRGWQSVDPIAPGEWMPDQPERWLEPAYALAASALGPKDPVAAIALSDRIQSQHWRNEAYYRIGQRWLDLDEAAARAWMEDAGVSDALRERIEYAHERRMAMKAKLEAQAQRRREAKERLSAEGAEGESS